VLPRWSTADAYESLEAPAFRDAMERMGADMTRLTALFDEHDIRTTDPRPVTPADGAAADAAIAEYNRVATEGQVTAATAYAFVSSDSRDERAQAALAEIMTHQAAVNPLLARLADWVHALGVDELASVSPQVADHKEPLRRLAERAAHQMNEAEEHLYAELSTIGSTAWS